MAFDELVPTTSTREVQAAAMERSMRWARRSRDAFDGGGQHAAENALFGIQQGGAGRGVASGVGEGADRHRVRRLCHRRACGRRGAGGDVRLPRLRAGAVAGGQAALSDGRGQADRYRRRGRARGRHVRLRVADPVGADGAGLHPGRGRSTSRMRGMPRIRGRSIRLAPAPSARSGAGRICIT